MKTIKNTLYFFFFLMIAVPLSLAAQQNNGYVLTGHLKGLSEGGKVVMNMMVYMPDGAIEIPRDSAYTKNGEFQITGNVPEGPRIYWLRVGPLNQVVRLFIDNGQHITLSCENDITKIPHDILDDFVVCQGSNTQYACRLFERFGRVFDMAQNAYSHTLQKVRDSLGYDAAAAGAIINSRAYFETILPYWQLNPIPADMLPAATYFAFYESGDHSPYWLNVYNQLDQHQKESLLGKKLQQRLLLLESEKLPGFNLPDQTGKTLTLDEIAQKGKATIVYIWANKSVSRKKCDAELRELYKKYHEKGLSIVGISTEADDRSWKAALAQEKYPWYNVYDPKGVTVVDSVYHEYGFEGHENTAAILVDAQGKIITWDQWGLALQYHITKELGL